MFTRVRRLFNQQREKSSDNQMKRQRTPNPLVTEPVTR